jgi:hypothetical protein
VKRTDAFYAKVAVEYDAIENNDRRDLRDSTRATLAHRHKVPVTTIGKWIRVARARGFLTSVSSRGLRGGTATRAAHDLLAKRGSRS